MTRIYCSEKISPLSEIFLSEKSTHHLTTVLRIAVGTSLIIFDGSGVEYLARVEEIKRKSIRLYVLNAVCRSVESPLFIELVQSISRGDRMDYAIQKAVELGVHAITPMISERCVIPRAATHLKKRMLHWQGIIIAACEQSGRARLPTLNPIVSIEDWLLSLSGDHAAITSKEHLVCIGTPESADPNKLAGPPKQVSLLIGAEGGFTPAEIKAVQQAGGLALQLGPRVLRTETAAVVGLTCVQMLWGDLRCNFFPR